MIFKTSESKSAREEKLCIFKKMLFSFFIFYANLAFDVKKHDQTFIL